MKRPRVGHTTYTLCVVNEVQNIFFEFIVQFSCPFIIPKTNTMNSPNYNNKMKFKY